ncbi:hypothetical protein D3C76_418000 [compost metagenome]
MGEESNTPTRADKKPGMSTYIVIAILVLIAASFAVEALSALKEGRPINTEFVGKLLDTLMALMNTPSSTT